MKSVKPGRGPSMMGGFAGIFVALFGFIWTVNAAVMTGSFLFILFGIGFTAMAVGSAVYNFHNATSRNRFSKYDIMDGGEEPDPLNQRYGRGTIRNDAPSEHGAGPAKTDGFRFCPYCGAELGGDFAFCPKCGRDAPKP